MHIKLPSGHLFIAGGLAEGNLIWWQPFAAPEAKKRILNIEHQLMQQDPDIPHEKLPRCRSKCEILMSLMAQNWHGPEEHGNRYSFS
jgi:hypothetical protein